MSTRPGWLRVMASWAATVVLLLPAVVRADAPLLDDGEARFTSANGRFFAVPGPKRKTTLVYGKRGPTTSEKLWEMPGWPYVAYLANDGEYLATADSQAHILPRHYKRDQVIVSFFRKGGVLIKAIHLDEVLRDPKSMGPPSESGYSWGIWSGFVALHRFALDTVEGRRLVYDVTSGGLVESTPSRETKPGVP